MQENKRRVGDKYERLAAEHLQRAGYRIRERNFRCKFGEVDLIAEKDGYLVFVEVKYRRDASMGDALAAVTPQKQERIRKTAAWYLIRNGYSEETPCRFDVVGITGTEITLVKDAFGI